MNEYPAFKDIMRNEEAERFLKLKSEHFVYGAMFAGIAWAVFQIAHTWGVL